MSIPTSVGPVLLARGGTTVEHRFSAVLIAPEVAPEAVGEAVGEAVREVAPETALETTPESALQNNTTSSASANPPLLETVAGLSVSPRALDRLLGYVVWRYDFTLPVQSDAWYRLDGVTYPVSTDWAGQARMAYVSCNGQEHADPDWTPELRNAMWHRLVAEHRQKPLSMLLHGGDQLYADDIQHAHPELVGWSDTPFSERGRYAFTPEAEAAATRFLFDFYTALYAEPDYAFLSPRVPSVMMWDDHDIMDGWGSHPEAFLDSPIGRGLFAISRRMFMLFQLGQVPDQANSTPTDSLPYQAGASPLSQQVAYGDFTIVAPDLRSERRPNRIMGEAGWQWLDEHLSAIPADHHVVLMSSVPLLGPRLSWVERLVPFIPRARNYEDDLRDQWQSRAHRPEWRRILERLEMLAETRNVAVTVVSGEIHLATRATMTMKHGHVMHQFVASGVSHPAPSPWFARALGWLASFGEDPLPGQPIALHAIPGQPKTYTAQRNYLLLEQQHTKWLVSWELEVSGRTPAVEVDAGAGQRALEG